MYISLESEVRDLRRAVEGHNKKEGLSVDGGDGFAMTLVIGFVIFLFIMI